MSTQAPLSPEEIAALQFLDRQPGEWYCTQCWARGVGGDVRVLHRFSVLMETTQALAPGHEAIANGPCGTCDPKGPRGAVLKSGRAVRSRGTRGKPQRASDKRDYVNFGPPPPGALAAEKHPPLAFER